MFDFLKRLLGGAPQKTAEPRQPAAAAPPGPAPSPAAEPARPPTTEDGARAYVARVQAKVAKLADDFAAGVINRAQFQDLYAHYQREIRAVEQAVEARQGDWREVATEGQSILIRRQKLARAEGYAIYDNQSGMPLATLGRFELEPDLIVPMLSSYRAAAAEMFGGGLRSTGIENGRWLCFVPGEFTTLLALFTVEPAPKQLEFLENLHRTFETANRPHLAAGPVDPDELIFPHEYSLGMWRSA